MSHLPTSIWFAEHVGLPKEAMRGQDDHIEANGEPPQEVLHRNRGHVGESPIWKTRLMQIKGDYRIFYVQFWHRQVRLTRQASLRMMHSQRVFSACMRNDALLFLVTNMLE